MYGHSIPTRVDNFLNDVMYPIEAPEYAMSKSIAIENGELDRIFVPDKNSMVLTRASIAMMIDFCDRVINFRILNGNDILEINKYLNEYIRQLGAYREIEDAAKYLSKARHFSEKLQRSVRILAKTNPKAQQVLDTDNLSKLFTSPIPQGEQT